MKKDINMTNFEMLEQRLMMSANDAFAAALPADEGFGADIIADDSGATLDDARLVYLNTRGAGRLVGRVNYTQDIDLLRLDATQSGRMQAAVEIDAENPELNCTLAVMSASGNPVAVERDDSGPASLLKFQVERGESYFICIFGDGQNIGKYTVNVATLDKTNTAPSPADDQISVDEDQAAFDIAALANDTDVDGDAVMLQGYTQAAHGLVILNDDGSFNYIPDKDFNGADSFSYTVSDGQGGEATATVSITVNPVNDAPLAENDAATLDEDGQVTLNLAANDSDIDGDALQVISAEGAGHGQLTVNADGTVTYTPVADFNGSDSFSYTVSDGHGGTATATVEITVTAVNDAPTLYEQSLAVNEDASLTVTPAGDDAEGDPLTVVSTTDPAHGSVSINGDGTLSYTPDADYNGLDSFSITVSDGNGGEATAAVQITVIDTNDAPVAVDRAISVAEDGSVVIADLGSDIDGDALTVASVTPPAFGQVVINGDGTLTYTPEADYDGPDSFSYTVSDGHGGTATATVAITVTAANDAPVAVDRSVETPEDGSVVISNLATDADGDDLSVVAVTDAAHGTVVARPDGKLIYWPDANFNGVDSFSYTVSDGNGGEATATVSITVTAVNDAPIAADRNVQVAENGSVVISNLATDIDGDALSVISTTAAAHGNVTVNGDGTLTYAPAADYNGPDSFSYTVSDGNGGEATATVTITVSSVNDAPVATDRSVEVAEDGSVVISNLATDIDGDALSVISTTAAAHGSVTVNGDGTLTYAPAADYNGSDSFSYTVSDGNGGEATATVTITVSSVNDAPVATDRSVEVAEDGSVVISNLATDIDGDALSVISTTAAAHGNVTVNGDGTLTYAPAADYNGPDSFSYTVSDGNGGEATATVTITVSSVNDAPVATDRSVEVAEDGSVVISNLATDIDGDALSVILTTAAAHGNVTVNGDGTLTYAPAADYNGPDSFSYTVSDGNGGEATATVSLTVTAVNDQPNSTDKAYQINEDSAKLIGSLGADIDGDALTVVSITGAAHGTVTDNGNGTLTYRADADYNGLDSFSYTLSDGNGGTTTATVTLTIAAVNDAPVANDASVQVSEDGSVVISNLGSDIDGDALAITAGSPAHGSVTVNGDGTVSYTPAANFYGSDSFSFTVSDGHGGSDSGTVTLSVTAVNDAPVANDASVQVSEDGSVVISNLGSDIDGDALAISAGNPAHGTVTVNGDGTVSYTPAANFYGADSFSFTVSDGHGGSDSGTVTLNVTAVNDAPTVDSTAAQLDQDASVVIDLLAGAADIDGDALSIVSVAGAAHGSVVINGDGTVTYTPEAGYFGADSFSFTVGDGRGGTASATVSVTVDEVDGGSDEPFVPVSGSVVYAQAVTTTDGLTLVICGTDGDDVINIDQLAGGIMFYSGPDGTFFEGDFAAVAVYGFAGNDWLRTSSTVSMEAYLYGGDGADQVFHNGLGGATLTGDAGDDLLVSIGGSVNTLTGGDGLDSFWNDSVDLLADVSADETAARAVHSIDEFHQPYTTTQSDSRYISKEISGQNFTDPTITSAATGYTSFVDSPLYTNGPDFNDIRQGQIGDCYFLASLAAFAQQDVEVIRQSIAPLGDGTYAVRFYQYDGTEVVLRMDADLPTKSGSLVYAKSSDGGEIWVPMLEKAYAYFRYNGKSYSSIESGWMTSVYQEMTGNNAEMVWSNTYSDAGLFAYFQQHLDAGHAVTMGSNYTDIGPIVGNHAYTVIEAFEQDGAMYVTVYNPWGFDGRGGDSDGLITMTIAQAKSYFMQITSELV